MRLLALDVDGVLTDGTKVYDSSGLPVNKSFCDLDFTAIKKFKELGWRVVWFSADPFNKAVADRRGIDFINCRGSDGQIDKISPLLDFLKSTGIDLSDVVFVGDDLFDVPVARLVIDGGGKSYCPLNAAPHLKRFAEIISQYGGSGVVMSLLFDEFSTDEYPPCE